MFENMTEEEARKQVLEAVGQYCDRFHGIRKPFEPGDRITYASRVYDRNEMMNLVDSSLDFWLTSGSIWRRNTTGINPCSTIPNRATASRCSMRWMFCSNRI